MRNRLWLLAAVVSSIIQVASSELLALSASSSSPGQLDVLFGSAAVTAGAAGASQTSCGVLNAWIVTVTELGGTSTEVDVGANCNLPTPSLTGHTCQLGLQSNTDYTVEVMEECNETEARNSSSSSVRTLPQPASAPNLVIADVSRTSLSIEWSSGGDGDCIFQSWEAEWRPFGGSWMLAENETGTSELLTGLQENTAYEFRVRQLCSDSSLNSAYADFPESLLTLPGIFSVFVGTSTDTRVIQLSYGPSRCRVLKQCCGDQFTVCHSGEARKTVTLSRMDVMGGWGQPLWLQCTAQSVADYTTFTEVQAPAPLWLQLHEATATTMKAKYRLGYIIDETATCDCATLSLELRADDSDVWNFFPGRDDSCTITGTRDCFLIDALPDKKYWGRMKMSCENSSVDSEYTYTEDYIITPPACIWSTHTGQWGQPDQFECVDGTYCSETDPSCCVPHSGRIRCPASTPFMCHNPWDCADSQERCCKATEEECNDHGGLRTCEVPAKTPLLTQVESLGPASLTISWEPQEYLIGYSSCQFLEWRVAISQVHIYGEGQWIWMRECDTRDYNKRSCTIENLRSLTDYNVRVWAQCTVVELSSYPNRTTVAVGTRPIPAVPPSALFCTGLEPLRFYADWWASDPEDCEFVAWELEAQLLPRTAGFTEDGLFEGAAPGGEYETKCVLYDRDLRECWVTDLLADRDYKIRVRETCTNPLANSEFFIRYQECATLTMPAFNPENLTHYNEDLYTFEVSWDPGDPKACIFQYWEVQVKVNDTDWPAGDDPPVFGCRVLQRSTTKCMVHVGLNSGKAFQVRMREACTVRRLYTDWVYYDEVVETRLPVPASMPENLTANSTSPNHDISFASLDVAWDAHPPGECIFTGWKVETRIHDRNRDWEESAECRANPREPFECQITQGLLSNVYYDMRITETCVDPNALGDTLTVLDIARTRPVPAVAPFIVSVYATSARSLGVRISQRAAGQCVFEAYKMEWKMQGWDYWLPYDDCTPRSTTTCSVSGFPASQSYYTVRMKESCTDPMADSPWVEWPDFVLTWPEPAQIPSNFTAVELTAYNMTFTFEPGLGLDCTWSSWEVQILQGDAGPLATEWMDLTECYLPFRENVTCSVTNLQSFTVYQVRVRERCTDFIYDSDWGYSDPILTTMPVQAGVPADMRIVPNSITAFFFDVSWQAGASGQCIFKEWVMEVYQTSPDPEDWAFAPLPSLQDPPGVWVRHACGASRAAPICRPGDLPRTLKQNSTYAVRVQETCTDPNANGDFAMLSENATTIIATIPADPPENLTVSNETAYTFLLEFDAGEPYDCYFTGWAVEVRENWTDGNFSNETNYTELNYSLWVPRDECKNEEAFPRNRMRCVVPRLRKHSIYDAKVRETCYDGYTELLDSDFSSELPDRQAETLVPVAATSPFGLVSLSQGPYSFSLAWSAGDPKDCLYQKWLVEIKDDNYTGDVWREAIECGREARAVTSCTITMLHEGYLGEEAHLRSNTEYEVRVKEFCQTYTSIYDPWGGSRERAEYLDSPIHYLPADQLPRTLAPVPTLTPLNFKVNETDHQSFRLSWEAQISNDCRFRNWTVEIRLVIHCIAGVGYTNCTEVEDQPWEVPGTCVIEDRSVTSCKVHNVKSYSFYEVKMRERCSDATAESADATLIAEVWPFLSDAPDNMTVTSPEPFTLNVKWDPGDPQECVFSHWDVQVQGRRVGDLDDTFSRESVTDKWYGMIWDLEGNASFLNWSTTIDSCRLVGQRDVAECNITGLISNALYDVRIAERCVDERADSPWLVERLQATIPAWALMPLGPNVSNVTTTTMDLEWAASEPRDCLFSSWKVEVKPTAITDDDWIPVPECSLPDRDATSCQIVGLQSYTSYDIRIQETCIHDTSNSPYLLEENSFTTLVGSVVYVGTNPNTNSKAIFFGSRGLNACAYHTKCCADEFSLCYSSQEVDVIRTDLPDAGWGQDLYLSCVADTVPQDDMKRIVARPPAKLEAVDRTANSIDLVWLPYGSGGYMSDCYCSEWNIFVRRQGTTEWLLSPDCRNMPFSQSSCTVQNLEDNWLAPNTVYEIRVRQTCSFDRLSSPYKEIQVPTLPGCTFSQHSGRDDYFVCADGFFSFIFDGGRFDGDGTGCWRRGGRARCAKNFPYMCASPDSCAKVDSLQTGGVRADHCCMTEPCGSRNGGDRVCLVRPLPPADIVVTSPSPYSLMVDWQEQDFADTTYYPCSFRRWQVDLSQYFFEHWSSEWTAAPECYIEERRRSHCTITGLESNARYYVRVREVCEDDALNGDYLQHPGLVQVNPLPAGAVTDVIEAHRDIYWINVTWIAGLPNDCVFVAWQIEAVAGGETRAFTTVGQPRLPAYLNMTGLTDGTVFQIFVTEVCENPLANSAAVEALVSSRPNPAQDPQQPTVTAAGPYWLNVEWSAGQPGTCSFLSWDVTVRKTGTEQFDSVAVCSETAESTTSCNITESYSCFQDRKYSGFYDVCIPGVACPITDVQSATDCKLLCSYEPACRALRFQAAYGHCWLIDSSYNPLEDNPIYQTTGCARNLGLASLTGYEVQVAHRCTDPEADSSPAIVEPGLAPNHTTVGHATQPEDVEERAVHGRTIRIHFVPGVLRDYMPIRDGGPRLEMDDSTDCVFKKWAVQVRLNASEAPSDGPVSCWQYPMFCEQVWHTVPTTCADMYRETSWCDVHVIWSEELYQLRLREECQDPAADSPYTADPIWVTSGRALPAENVENLTAFPFLAGHNVSVALDWDAGEANDCVFTGWELELRPVDGEWFLAEECISSLYEDVNCTVTEGLLSETTYDTRVRSYCLDLLSKGNWTEVLELFTTPAIPADPPLVRLETVGPRQMRFSMEPQDPWDCAFVAYVGELSEADTGKVVEHQRGDEDDWRPANESLLCMPAARVGAECLLDGLMSNTTYKVRICENCSNPQAEVCAEAMNTTLTLNPDAVRSVQVVFRSETHAHVNFISGDQPGDCNAEDWLFEYYNESWQFAAFCTRMPGARTPQQCHLDLSMLDEEREYWMRVQELCVGGLQAPHVNFTLPAWEAESGSFMAEKDVSNMSNRSNMSEMEEEEDELWESNYSNYSMENVTMMNMTGHMDMGMNMSETNMSEPITPNMSEPSMTEMNMSMAGMNATDSNMSEMHQPEMNETSMNESDVGGYAADMNDTDTDENDTDVNDSEMNETDMAEWENSSYGNGSNDSQVSSSTSEGGNDVVASAEKSLGCSVFGCLWTLGEWSECSTGCGEGTRTRSVSCPSGNIEDCPKPMPETVSLCFATQNCSWVLSSWTQCNATCGAGVEELQWTCPTGSESDCGALPSTHRNCYATSGCMWLASNWTTCSSQCGYGTRERTVTCSGSSEEDCGRARPDATEVCHETAACSWVEGEWSSCSSMCGQGFRTRNVSCSSGILADCDSLQPAILESCYNISGCQWSVSSWSACSSSCGTGYVNRTVACESGAKADCSEPEPTSSEACQDSSGCGNWTASDWSTCNVSCGTGFQERTVTCVAGICPGDGPAHVQSCVNTTGCFWQPGEWSNCSTSCGSGVRSRTLYCPTGSAQDCGESPASYEACLDTSGCVWQVGDWSSCDGDGCGQRVRAVYCQSGQDEDCQTSRPSNISTCDLEVCLAPAAESASFDVVLEVNNETNASALAGSLQQAVADSLQVPVEAVSVEPVLNGRRLASLQTLQFIVQVRDVSRGLAEFLSSETSLQAVAVDVAQELTETGIPAGVQLVAREPTTSAAPPWTTAPPHSTTEPPTTTSAAAEVTSSAQSTRAPTSQGPGASSNLTGMPGLIKEDEVSPTLTAGLDNPEGSPLLAVGLGAVAVLFLTFGYLLWHGRRRQKIVPEGAKGAWTDGRRFQYPWDSMADGLAQMIWSPPDARGKKTKLEEDQAAPPTPTDFYRRSVVGQSPDAVQSAANSLSGSLGSEAGQVVAAAASQVRATSTVTAAAAQMRVCEVQASGGSEDGSTRPSSGNSQPKPPQSAEQSALALPLPRSPMRRMDWPEANPAASNTALRSTASPSKHDSAAKWELMPPSTTPPAASPPRAKVAAVRVLRKAPDASARAHMSPPALPTLPPTAVRIASRKGGSSAQEPPESERSRASSWEASRTPPVSHTPRSEGDKAPPPDALGGEGTLGARSP